MTAPEPSKSPEVEFLARVEGLVGTAYAETFSGETRTTRNLLLTTALVLMLVSVGALSLSTNPATVPVLGLSFTVKSGLRAILTLLCTYFLVAFCARAYAEWHVWRLKHQAPILQLHEESVAIAAMLAKMTERQTDAFQKSWQLYEKLVGVPQSSVRQSVEAERAALLEDFTKADRDFYAAVPEGDRQKLLAAQMVILDLLHPLRRTLKLRFWIEAIFPAAFGILAIVTGIIIR